MEIAFIIDPIASLKAYKDTTVSMMRSAHDGVASWLPIQSR